MKNRCFFKVLTISIFSLLVISTIMSTRLYSGTHIPEWVRNEHWREFAGLSNATYNQDHYLEFWRKIKSGGGNVVNFTYMGRPLSENYPLKKTEADFNKAEWYDMISGHAKEAEELGLRFFPYLYLFWYSERTMAYYDGIEEAYNGQGLTAAQYILKDPTATYDVHGNRRFFMPCPTQKEYWDTNFGDPAIQFAKWSLNEHKNFSGMRVDFERYGSLGGYFRMGTNKRLKHKYGPFCDHAFNGFLQSKNIKTDIPMKERYDYLYDNNLINDYSSYLFNTTYNIFKEIVDKVHSINPDFVLSFYPGLRSPNTDNWLNNSFGKALGDSKGATLNHTPTYGYSPSDHTFYGDDFLLTHNLLSTHALTPENYVGKLPKATRDALNSSNTTGLGYWVYWHTLKPDDMPEFFPMMKWVNDLIDHANYFGGGIKANQSTSGPNGYFESQPVFIGVMYNNKLYNMLPPKLQQGTYTRGFNKQDVRKYFSPKNVPHEYLLSFDIDITPTFHYSSIRYSSDTVFQQVAVATPHNIENKNQSGKKTMSVPLKIPAGEHPHALYFYAKKHKMLPGFPPLALTGSVETENVRIVKMEDVTFVKPGEIPPFTTVVGTFLDNDPHSQFTQRTYQVNNGVLVKLHNGNNVHMYGKVWFENLEDGAYYLIDPLAKTAYQNASEKLIWSKAELEAGINVLVRPQGSKWLIARKLDPVNPKAVKGGKQPYFAPYMRSSVVLKKDLQKRGFIYKTYQTHLEDLQTFIDNSWTLGHDKLYDSYYKGLRKKRRAEFDFIKSGGFEYNSFSDQSDWVIKNGSAEIVYDLDNPDKTKELAPEGGRYLNLGQGSAISQLVKFDFTSMDQKGRIKLNGFYRTPEGGTITVELKQANKTDTVTFNMQKNGRIWSFFDFDVTKYFNNIFDEVEVTIKTANSVELDRLELTKVLRYYE